MSDTPFRSTHPLPRPPAVKLRRVARSYPAMRSIGALVLREMSTRYGRSAGGYVWALLEPLGGILILSLGFSLLLRSPPLGNSFLLFYASGFLPFQVYMTLSNAVQRSITFSRPLLFYPAVAWIDALMARFILNALTGLLVAQILLTGILIVSDTRASLDIVPLIFALGLACLLGLAVGTMNCVIMGLFPVWEQVWSIAMRPIFIVSGILFIYDDLPSNVQAILWWNPILHIVGLMRTGIYANYHGAYISVLFVVAVSMLLLAAGFLLMGRYHRQILNS